MEFKTFSIGEMSKLFNLNVQTLRYYDKIGLFVPEYRDDNNYRKYRFEQCYKLAAICHMRQVGYSLKLIAEIMDSRNVETSMAEMQNRLFHINKEIEHLKNMEDVLKRKMNFIEEQLLYAEDSTTVIREFETRYYLPIGTEELLYKDKSFYLNPTIVFYHNTKRKFGAYLGTEKEFHLKMDQISEIKAGKYLCAWHKGNYSSIWQHVMDIRKENRHLNLGNWSVHFNIIDQFVEKNGDNFLTMIQIPITERRGVGDRS
jgi:DNA-binding transcriptional MerR regulator